MPVIESLKAQRRLLFSNAFDAAGRSVADFAADLIFVVLLGANAFQMGLLNALGSVAFVVVGIPLGHAVDRFTPLRTLRVGLAAKFFLLLAMVLLLIFGALQIPIALLLATLLGVCNALSETSQVSLAPALSAAEGTDRERELAPLVARLAAADQSLAIIIPAAAGIGFTILGAPALLTVAIALLALALYFALLLSVPSRGEGHEVPEEHHEAGSFMRRALAGFSYLGAQRPLLMITLIAACSNLGLAIGSSVEAIFVLNYLDLGPAWFGVLGAVGGVGGVGGAWLAPRIAQRYHAVGLVRGTTVLQAALAGLVLLAAFLPQWAALSLLAVHSLFWGVAVIAMNVAVTTWSSLLTPERLLGRVVSARRTLTFGVVPLGSLLGGWMGLHFGIPVALGGWVVATLCAAGFAVGGLRSGAQEVAS
ncbi:MFS transporter [Glutamicibacter endophyticus]